MLTTPDTNSDQPDPDLRTRPMHLQKRLGAWLWIAIAVVWIAIAVVFIVLAIVIFAVRTAVL